MKKLEFMFVAILILLISLLIATFIVFMCITIKNAWNELKQEEEDEYYQKQLIYQDRLKRISRSKDE